MRTARSLLFADLAVLVSLILAMSNASANHTGTHHDGNNWWTQYRLPWQHHKTFTLTQGYNQGNHRNSANRYSLDFNLPSNTRVVGLTWGWSCRKPLPNPTQLGIYVVQQAGSDYYFYGHLDSSWLPNCSSGQDFIWQGQILGLSGNTGYSSGPHLHITRQNPGNQNYTGTSVRFPALSGISTWTTNHTYTSDSVMVGDNNTTPDPTFYQAIFDKWYALGNVDTMGVAWNRDGLGPGVHSWGSGGVFQDTVSAYGIGGIFLKNEERHIDGLGCLRRHLPDVSGVGRSQR